MSHDTLLNTTGNSSQCERSTKGLDLAVLVQMNLGTVAEHSLLLVIQQTIETALLVALDTEGNLHLTSEVLLVILQILLIQLLNDDVIHGTVVDDRVLLVVLGIVNVHGEGGTGHIVEGILAVDTAQTLELSGLLGSQGTGHKTRHVLTLLLVVLAVGIQLAIAGRDLGNILAVHEDSHVVEGLTLGGRDADERSLRLFLYRTLILYLGSSTCCLFNLLLCHNWILQIKLYIKKTNGKRANIPS